MITTPDDNNPPEPPVGSPDWGDDGRLWTAAELDQLTPDQRAELARQRHQPITDLSTLNPEFVERIRATARRLAEARRGGAPD